MRVRRSRPLWLAGLLCGLAATVLADAFTGAIRGRVRDGSGGAVRATVDLVDQGGREIRSTIANQQGEYAFAGVASGTYTVRLKAPRFGNADVVGVRVGVQSFLTLHDVVLQPGPRGEEVTVQATAPLLEASAASGGSIVDRAAFETLPSAGRNSFLFSAATPHVVHSGDPQFVRQQDQTSSSAISVGGGPRRANNYTLDGVSITDLRNRATIIPSLEATEEIRVQVAAFDADVGRTGGGVFNTTTRSGSNMWHGGFLGQTRPQWGQGRLYFDQKACDEAEQAGEECRPKPDTHYYLFGGSFGGPIQKDRTFFRASFEGYNSRTARSAVMTLPTQRERQGDFSQSGVTIFDPLTTRPDGNGGYVRDPFPGNLIPANRLNPVSLNMLPYLPLPTSGNTRAATAEPQDHALQAILKLDHRFSSKYQAALTYAWYDSEEPESLFYAKDPGENPGDPAGGALYRTVHLIAFNNTIIPSSNTVWTLRYGYTSFDDSELPNPFDPATLGFSPEFLAQIPYGKFPVANVSGIGSPYGTFGDRGPQETTYYSHSANVGLSKLFGRHTLKVGADYRYLGLKLFAGGQPSGRFSFDEGFTRGPAPLSDTTSGSAFASFLLGYPAGGNITVATRNQFRIHYYAAQIQDDFRVTSALTLTMGLRIELEQGLEEAHDSFTVGFDRERAWPFAVPGVDLRGGLMYAGIDGYPTRQGDTSSSKLAPRVGVAWTPDPRTVVRGGFGRFWAPTQYGYPTETRLGTRGFTAITDYVASFDGGLTPCPECSFTNPFPFGVQQPRGSADGIQTGAGGSVYYVDQFQRSPYVDQFSLQLQRELPGGIVASVGYLGSRGERLPVGGSDQALASINQLDASYLSLGAALLEPVPNPFYGDERFGALALAPTVTRSQLLRPYPQFGDVYAHQVSEGFSRYHALAFELQRRFQDGWAFDINYTLSSLKDNLFGESNFNSGGSGGALDFDNLGEEYARSVLGATHRLNISGVYTLPFGRGQKHLTEPGLLRTLAGGWMVSIAASWRSGYPVSITQANRNSGLSGNIQRPNLTGADPASSGSTEDRLGGWFNPAAWSDAEPFTLGNSPRTETRAKTPSYMNCDVAFQKTEKLWRQATGTLRIEVINLFDTPNFQGPNTAFGTPNFGLISGVGGFPRMLQVTLRLAF